MVLLDLRERFDSLCRDDIGINPLCRLAEHLRQLRTPTDVLRPLSEYQLEVYYKAAYSALTADIFSLNNEVREFLDNNGNSFCELSLHEYIAVISLFDIFDERFQIRTEEFISVGTLRKNVHDLWIHSDSITAAYSIFEIVNSVCISIQDNRQLSDYQYRFSKKAVQSALDDEADRMLSNIFYFLSYTQGDTRNVSLLELVTIRFILKAYTTTRRE